MLFKCVANHIPLKFKQYTVKHLHCFNVSGDNRRTNIILLGVATVVAALTFLIYVDMLIFVTRHFKLRARQVRTTWIISIFPVRSS